MGEYRRPRGYCGLCNTRTAPMHSGTKRHRRFVARRAAALRGDMLSRQPAFLRDPYGDRRDWAQESIDAMVRESLDDVDALADDGADGTVIE